MAFEPGGGQPPPTVLLDANLLYPFHFRNMLVQLGMDSLVRSRWTTRIHDEWIGTLAAAGRVTRERLLRTRDVMERVLPGADVPCWECRLPDVPALPDPDDRHVVAAALEAPASTILTLNLRDFPAALPTPFGITAEHPDKFLSRLCELDPEAVRASAEAAHANLSRSAPSFEAFLDALARQGLPAFAARLRAAGRPR